MITLELPTAPPSINRLMRMHWAKRAQLAEKIRGEIVAESLDAGLVVRFTAGARSARKDPTSRVQPPAKGHRHVRITRRGPRTLDDDNLRGGCKPLVDALVKVGLIEDDTPALVTVQYEQDRGSGCRVEVWE